MGPPVWRIGAGANMAFRKEVFDEVGLFDIRLGAGASGCSEDSEMWYRILLKGHEILYTPRTIVYHRHRQDFKALYKQMFSYMRGFAAAALIQQQQHEEAGYRKHIFRVMPRYYYFLLLRGFPLYRLRFRTVLSEIRGFTSGIIFYMKNKHRPSQPQTLIINKQ
jgi:GT2 family glycosyltransferase